MILENDHVNLSPDRWFRDQLPQILGADVFSRPFPHGNGYDIYRGLKARVLIVRAEDMDRVLGRAINEFVGVEYIQRRENVSSSKPQGVLYDNFVRNVRLPAKYLDRMYDMRYSRHFYSMEEIEGFRSRWLQERR